MLFRSSLADADLFVRAIMWLSQYGDTHSTCCTQVQAYGARPNTELIATLDRDVITPQGLVRVNKHLEIPNHPGVFAAGDIIDWPEQKQAHKAVEHVPVVVGNVLSYLEGKPPREEYRGSPETIVIPVGKVRNHDICAGRGDLAEMSIRLGRRFWIRGRHRGH